ncbi:hypothetical protein BC941DRAFT_83692 [Chlamydoabsidia padenii]|nr:hypothetical protein BC941DRAFT_83692 [Chlamydoabsidia padenii]
MVSCLKRNNEHIVNLYNDTHHSFFFFLFILFPPPPPLQPWIRGGGGTNSFSRWKWMDSLVALPNGNFYNAVIKLFLLVEYTIRLM